MSVELFLLLSYVLLVVSVIVIIRNSKFYCTVQQRMFLDRIEMYGDFDINGNLRLPVIRDSSWGDTIISQKSFPGVDLDKVQSGRA